MRDVAVQDGTLVVKTDEQEARFELGAAAEKWARLIKEPTGLLDKLDVPPQSRVAVFDVNDAMFMRALRERAPNIAQGRVPEGAAVIFFGAETTDALRKIQLVRARMTDTGILWVIRPKGNKAITEADVFEAIRAAGLTDTKVVAFSKTHTAHKCVIPVELRGKPIPRRPVALTIPRRRRTRPEATRPRPRQRKSRQRAQKRSDGRQWESDLSPYQDLTSPHQDLLLPYQDLLLPYQDLLP